MTGQTAFGAFSRQTAQGFKNIIGKDGNPLKMFISLNLG
jgi:hypothetical protein